MKIVFSFNIKEVVKKRGSRLKTIFYIGSAPIDEDIIFRAVDAHYLNHTISDEVIFLVPSCNLDAVVDAFDKKRVPDRIWHHLDENNKKLLRLFVIKYDGSISECSGSNFKNFVPVGSDELLSIKQSGAFEIFTKHNGMLEASDSHHYVKPSLKHTDRFIRSGSVLVHGVEIEFLAIWLLKELKENTRHIYTDSSTINSVAFALINLRTLMSGCSGKSRASIHSYESYKGLKDETFPDKANMIVLISASTGGAMIDELINGFGIDRSKIITLFYLGAEKKGLNIICDLTESTSNPFGYKPATLTNSGDRGVFGKHSLPVHILAESFVPENPHIEAINIQITDMPHWWGDFKSSFIGKKTIKCFAPGINEKDMSNPPPSETIISIANTLKKRNPFNQRLNQMLITAIPASLKTVISFEDESSEKIVNIIKRLLGKKKDEITWVKESQLSKLRNDTLIVDEDAPHSTLVVCGVVTNGAELLNVGQILRNTQKNHAISFFVGLAACSSENSFKELKSNLVYSQSGVQYGFHVVQQIEMARKYRDDSTCWDDEIEFWQDQFKKITVRSSDSVSLQISSRLGILRSGRACGLEDNLFLSSSNSNNPSLSISRNSIFTDKLEQDLPFTQADVFFAAKSVLHHLRSARGNKKNLAQAPHKRNVLSPALFFRFTDGVIQSAFLRAATAQELDYRMSPDLSKEMSETLYALFHEPGSQRAEALLEVLYSLASKKVRLLHADLEAFIQPLSESLKKSGEMALEQFLLDKITTSIPKRKPNS